MSDERGQAEGEANSQAAKFYSSILMYGFRFEQQPRSIKLLRHTAEQPQFDLQILRAMPTVEQYSAAEL